MMFFAKDFIETREGLLFAVVEHGLERNAVLCFLRYRKNAESWEKQSTGRANDWLSRHHPELIHDCPRREARLHAVPRHRIHKHHRPKQRLRVLLSEQRHDAVEADLLRLCKLFEDHGLDLDTVGVTGSLLIGVQNDDSDLDLVFYDRNMFHRARSLVRELIAKNLLQALGERNWQESYQRRGCHIDFDDYVWHERRKFNKGLVNGRKFDLSLIDPNAVAPAAHYRKLGKIRLRCRVTDAGRAFDYPAIFLCDEPSIDAIVVYTATYVGQAQAGETIEVSGSLEASDFGERRIIVGSSREAHGEYITVLR